jgi:hypothetical protein
VYGSQTIESILSAADISQWETFSFVALLIDIKEADTVTHRYSATIIDQSTQYRLERGLPAV